MVRPEARTHISNGTLITTLNADTGASPSDRDHPMSDDGGQLPPERLVLDRAEQLAQTGSWDWNLEADVLLWSDNMFRLLGLEPAEITPTPDYVVGRIHPEDRERVERELEAARAVGILPDVTYRITMPDGSVAVTTLPCRSGGRGRGSSIAADRLRSGRHGARRGDAEVGGVTDADGNAPVDCSGGLCLRRP